jgi:hypothetical protein
VALDEIRGVIKSGIRLLYPLDLILVALAARHPPFSEGLGVGGGEARLGGEEMRAGADEEKSARQDRQGEKLVADHLPPPLLAEV